VTCPKSQRAGFQLAALDDRAAPECPPGPGSSRVASRSNCRHTTSESCRSGIPLDRGGIQPACASRDDSHAHGVGVIVLAAAPVGSTRTRGSKIRGDVGDIHPVAAEPRRQGAPRPDAPSIAHVVAGPPTGEAAQRTIAVAAVQDALCGSIAITTRSGVFDITDLKLLSSPRFRAGKRGGQASSGGGYSRNRLCEKVLRPSVHT
jgi:hypothetical protein